MKPHRYPAVPLSWVRSEVGLSAREQHYAIAEGYVDARMIDYDLLFLEVGHDPLNDLEIGELKDTLFRILLIQFHKCFFNLNRPLAALEVLAVDFGYCPTQQILPGLLLCGQWAGIAERLPPPGELDPEYFSIKIKVYDSLTKAVWEIVRQGVRAGR